MRRGSACRAGGRSLAPCAAESTAASGAHIHQVHGPGESAPQGVGPQCETVSPTKRPGASSPSSPALRIVIEESISGEGQVVETPAARPSRRGADNGRSSPRSSAATRSARKPSSGPCPGRVRPDAQARLAGSASRQPGTSRSSRPRAPRPVTASSLRHTNTSGPRLTHLHRARHGLGRRSEPGKGVVPRPSHDRDHFVQQLASFLLRRLPVLPRAYFAVISTLAAIDNPLPIPRIVPLFAGPLI